MILIGELGEVIERIPSLALIVYDTKHLKLTPKNLLQKAIEEDDAGDYTLLVYLYSAMLAGRIPIKWIKILAWLLKYRLRINNHLPEFDLTREERELMESIRRELSKIKRRIGKGSVIEYDLWDKTIKNKVPLNAVLSLDKEKLTILS